MRSSRAQRTFHVSVSQLEPRSLLSVVAPATDVSSVSPSAVVVGPLPNMAIPAPPDNPNRPDFGQALADLKNNQDFRNLYNRVKLNLNFDTTQGTNGGFLGSETGGQGVKSKQTVSIYLDSYEFTTLRNAGSPDYQRLLKDTIIHETIHAYINLQGQNNDLGLQDTPNLQNNQPTAYGTVAGYMQSRFPTNIDALNKYRDATYPGLYMDIDQASQALINKIDP